MSRRVVVELQFPEDRRKLQLPPPLHARLKEILDRQDATGKLSPRERRKATALTEPAARSLDLSQFAIMLAGGEFAGR
jgi:hypothetical protein